jgi:hypothetical protein
MTTRREKRPRCYVAVDEAAARHGVSEYAEEIYDATLQGVAWKEYDTWVESAEDAAEWVADMKAKGLMPPPGT